MVDTLVEAMVSEIGKTIVSVACFILIWIGVRLKTSILDYKGGALKGLKAEAYAESAVFNEPQDQSGAASPQSPQPLLRVLIINQTGAPVFVAAAAFRPRVKVFGPFYRTGVAVATKFKSVHFSSALELKFGPDNKIPYALIPPNGSESTWVRLKAAPSAEALQRRECGQVLLKYATESKTGTTVDSI